MKHLFLILVMLSAVAVVFLPFVCWFLADHGRYASSMVCVSIWVAILACLLVRGAT